MIETNLEVQKLTPAIGAEVHGIDLSMPLDSELLAKIQDALLENLVIFFRDQKITPEQQKALGRHFGKLHIHPAAPGLSESHPEIFVIKADETSKQVAGEEWHADVTCDPEPPMGSILYITEVPPNGGGDTLFANMYKAYDTLSPQMKKFLEGLTAVHHGEFYKGRHYAVDDRNKAYPEAEHPVIRTHPVTGRKLLFVNRIFTSHIVQLPRQESRPVLEMLYRHIETPEFQCRFKWQPGSVAFWDNRCTQHRAMWDYFPHRRYGHRVTVCGDRPF